VRSELYETRREDKKRERKEREDLKLRREKEVEEKRVQKIMEMKVPQGKPTNAAILKAEKVGCAMLCLW
jgi:hypothetical protein